MLVLLGLIGAASVWKMVGSPWAWEAAVFVLLATAAVGTIITLVRTPPDGRHSPK